MADQAKSKTEEAAEKAYAEAAAAVKATPAPAAKPAAKKAPAKKAAPKKVAAKKKVAKKAAPKPAPAPVVEAKPEVVPAAPKAAPKKKVVAKKASPKKTAAKPAPKTTKTKATPAKKTPTNTALKEKIMAKTTSDFTKTVKDAAAEVQTRLKSAYAKGSEFVSEATEFNKANVEAMVESGKVLASAAQEMGRDVVEETKSAFDTMTADAKKMAAIKSPTELFQLQGELARRNFDAMVAASSKNTEKMIKLANDAFAPLSSRMSVAAEKLTKAA